MLDFVIVGGGPVGLLCAVALRRAGRSVTVLERCASPRTESRSIGIHAASLAGLARLGLVDEFLARGVRIDRGVVVGSRGLLGSLELGPSTAEFGYALSVPQAQTEALLEAAARREGVELVRGAQVHDLSQDHDAVVVGYRRDDGDGDQPGEIVPRTARMLLGCDGADSWVRQRLQIAWPSRRLPGCYIMAEFPQTASLANDAWIFLTEAGLVESFPLPEGRRRWVVEVERRRDQVDLTELRELVAARTGHRIPPEPQAGFDPGFEAHASGFGVVHALASEFRRGRCLLLGDAAHVLSPFGGLGMNLGWLDAFALAEQVERGWTSQGLSTTALDTWATQRRRAARRALRQAAFNTAVGRQTPMPRLRDAIVWLAVHGPWRRTLTRRLAMLPLASPSPSPARPGLRAAGR
jgi:2-polyprenyl-6-methoxyphenol hydroxylase-like FAD-dependent oxidoreductase